MTRFSYSHSTGSTTVLISQDLDFSGFFSERPPGKRIAVADENLAAVLKNTHPGLFSLFDGVITIPEGEEAKSFLEFERLISLLAAAGADRRTTLVAVGGGVTGDLTGFAAATYMRGIPVVQIPTTLLSQIDSSIGGKTGINLTAGKNLLGAFWQPEAILIDPVFLKSLPLREVYSALGEMLKYCVLYSGSDFAEFTEMITTTPAAGLIQNSDGKLTAWIEKSVRYKTAVVEADEKEQNIRAFLNLGHTLGHAIEKHYGFDELRHGEAVSIGIWFASWLSGTMGLLDEKSIEKIKFCVQSLVPRKPQQKIWNQEAVMSYLLKDKKKESDVLTFILPVKIGKCERVKLTDFALLDDRIREFRKQELQWD